MNNKEMVVRSNGTNRTQWKQWAAGITATLSMLCNGTTWGWMTTSMPRLVADDSPIPVTTDQISWALSLMGVGFMIGPFISFTFSDTFGRKKTLLLASFFHIIGWLIVVFSTRAEHLYTGRTITGIGVGISCASTPLYVSEIADINIRGALGTLVSVNAFVGTIFACVIGPMVSVKSLSTIMLMIPVIFFCLFVWFPETPYYLASKKKNEAAAESLAFFKGISDDREAKEELEIVLLNIKQNSDRQSWCNKFRDMMLPNNRKALGIGLCVGVTQTMSGNHTTMAYLQVLFQKANISIDANLATIIVLTTGLVASMCSTVVVEKLGRRPLLLSSTLATSLTLAVLASYLMANARGVDVTSVNWLPIVVIVLFQLTFHLGLGPVPSTLYGELFPTNVRSIGNSILMVLDGSWAVVVTKSYQVIGDTVNQHTVYFILSGSCFLGFLVFLAFVPETKNKRFNEIQDELSENRLQCFRKPPKVSILA